MRLSERAVSEALAAMHKVSSLLKKLDERRFKEFGASLRTRLVDLPSLITEFGLLPVLSFYFAKSGEIYGMVFKAFEGEEVERLRGSEISKEDFGYALALKLVLDNLAQKGLIGDEEIKHPHRALERLSGSPVVSLVKLRPFLMELKKLAEALLPRERG